jgi:hypothetical protein
MKREKDKLIGKRVGLLWEVKEKVGEHRYKCVCIHCGYARIFKESELKDMGISRHAGMHTNSFRKLEPFL